MLISDQCHATLAFDARGYALGSAPDPRRSGGRRPVLMRSATAAPEPGVTPETPNAELAVRLAAAEAEVAGLRELRRGAQSRKACTGGLSNAPWKKSMGRRRSSKRTPLSCSIG